MFDALLAGVFAGYAIAVPVGVIAVLIIETGMMGGLRRGFAAGAGAATVDLLFCSLALVVGGLLNQLLAVALVPLQLLSGGILISIGVGGLFSLRTSSTSADAATDPRVRGSARQLYLRFIALTAMTPATILYFLALAIGLPGLGSDPMNAVAFTLGAAGASLSWQLLLGGIGAAAGRILPERAVTATRIVGQVLIIGFGTSIAVTALRSVA